MDRTSIIVIALCVVLLGLWSLVLMPKLYPPKPMAAGSTNAAVAPAAVAGTNQAVVPPPPAALSQSAAPAQRRIAEAPAPEEMRVVTNGNARYTFTSRGGGLKLVELTQYPETVTARRQKAADTNRVATLNTFTLAPTLGLFGGAAVEGDEVFKLTSTTNGMRAELSLTNGLSITKEFQLGTNYLVSAIVRFKNESTQTLALPNQEWFVGTATPLGPRDNGQAVGVLWYNGVKAIDTGASFFSKVGFACTPRTPPSEYRAGSSNVVWAAVHNRFFALALMPGLAQPAQEMVVRPVDLPRPTGEDALLVAANASAPQGFEAALVYPPVTLTAGQTVERELFIYAGPKEFQTLARLSDRFGNNIEQVMNFNWAGVVSRALLLGMNWLHQALKASYGLAIILITCIIKLVFWPLTQASTRSMKRMQTLQPQMKALQEKYKDDPVKMNRKLMEFMKENKVNPMGGCLPMVLQIPVFFGFYSMIQSAIELRGAHFLWAGDLSQPDTLAIIPGLGFIPVIGLPAGLPLNLLPLIMGGTMLWQSHLTPPSPGMDPMQAKIMRYMPLMFIIFMYNASAGLTLYWTVNNILSILQTKLTRTATTAAPAAKVPALTPEPKRRK